MANRPNSAGPELLPSDSASVDALARKVIEVVASRQSSAERRVDAALLKRFCEQVIARDPNRHFIFVDHLMSVGVRPEDIADLYIPEAARALGALWCEDKMSFADVTIGSARLQNLLRHAAPEWQPGWEPIAGAPSILVYVRPDEFHTLGAMVAAGQMRRVGYDVTLHMGYALQDTLKVLRSEPFDFIMISASGGERLESIRKLIEDMRNAADVHTPIAVGGSILETQEDVQTLTGADYAETDPRRVLRQCGLTIPQHGGVAPTESEI